MFQTYIIYIFLIIVTYRIAERAIKKNDVRYVLVIVGLFTIIAGLRKYSVGKDTVNYVSAIEMIANGQFNYVWGFETSFKYICLFFTKINSSATFVLIMFALITNLLIILRFWDFKDISYFPAMVLVYYVVFYFYSFNIMRQMCAVAIVFYATRYLIKKCYIQFIVAILLATLFHTSALLGMLFLVIEIIKWKYLDNKQKIFLLSIILIFGIYSNYFIQKLVEYAHYFEQQNFSIGIMLLAKLVFFLLSSFGLKKVLIKNNDIKKIVEKNQLLYRISTTESYYFIGILFTSLGYIFSYMDRIGIFFYIFECVYMGIILKNRKFKNWYGVIIIVLYFYLFMAMLYSGGQGQIPYLFVWQ